GVARVERRERDSLDVVFEEHRYVGEDGLQFRGELGEIELVNVERIGSVGAARLGVVEPVRRGDDQLAGGREHAAGLREEAAPVFEMLDHLERDYEIEAGIG